MHLMCLPVFRKILHHHLLLFVELQFFRWVQVVRIEHVDVLKKGVLDDVVNVLAT